MLCSVSRFPFAFLIIICYLLHYHFPPSITAFLHPSPLVWSISLGPRPWLA